MTDLLNPRSSGPRFVVEKSATKQTAPEKVLQAGKIKPLKNAASILAKAEAKYGVALDARYVVSGVIPLCRAYDLTHAKGRIR